MLIEELLVQEGIMDEGEVALPPGNMLMYRRRRAARARAALPVTWITL